MRTIFIADAHLRRPEDDNYRLLLRFLGELPGKIDRLVILGDFFEFWLGDSPTPFPHYKPVLDALENLTNQGTELLFFEGNHDFHLGRYFRSRFRAQVFPDSTILTMDNKRFFLCHGDRINRADHAYRLLRFLFRNPLTELLTRIIPSSVPAWVAVKLGDHSKGNHKTTAAKWDFQQLIRDFAADRFHRGDDVVITAHFHRPFLEQRGDKTLLALGDWISQFSYGEWQDGGLALKTFPGEPVVARP